MYNDAKRRTHRQHLSIGYAVPRRQASCCIPHAGSLRRDLVPPRLRLSLYVFIYASLVFALVQYAYFQFLDNGAFAELITTTMKQVAPVYEQNGVSKEEIKSSMDLITMITPVQWAFMFMMQNLFIGAIISLPIALIGKRNRY